MVHTLNTMYHQAPYLNRWNEVVHFLLQSHGIESRVIVPYRRVAYQFTDHIDQQIQYATILAETVLIDITLNRIKPQDTLVLSGGGGSTVYQILNQYRIAKGLEINVVTYWEQGGNILLSRPWQLRVNNKTPRYNLEERLAFRLSNHNLFRNRREKISFFVGNRIRNLYKTKFDIIPQPYDCIPQMASKIPWDKKEDIVVISEPVIRGATTKMLIAYSRDVKDKYQMVLAVRERLTRKQYIDLLTRAKIVIHPNKNTYDYSTILEGYAYGCVVLVPSVNDPVFERFIPDDFKFQVEAVYANKIIRMVRAREAFLDRVTVLMEVYNESVYDICTDIATEMSRELFDSTQFLQLIKQLSNDTTEHPITTD